MLLTGTFERTLDEKLRIALPKPLREALGNPVLRPIYLAPGTDDSLALYPEDSFEHLASMLADASPAAMDVRAFRRLFYARARRIEFDRQGRIRLPQDLAELAHLERDIILLGVQDHIEIWNLGLWNTYVAGRQERYDQIAEAALGGASTASVAEQKTRLKIVDRIPR